jgi:hypothetical protein
MPHTVTWILELLTSTSSGRQVLSSTNSAAAPVTSPYPR